MPPAKTPWTKGAPLRLAFVTVGDRGRKTGGYLYNARVVTGLREGGVEVEELVACGASPEEQRTAASLLGSKFDPSAFDVMVVDALARIVVAPYLDLWRAWVPVVALVHELPGVAGGEPDRERGYEEPMLRADSLVAVSDHGRSVLRGRGVEARRIHVVPPGFDGVLANHKLYAEDDAPLRALCVAQWVPRKGILPLVEAWTLRERPGAVLELIGETGADHEYELRVRAAVEAAPRGSIAVQGCVDDATLGAAYASADLFVLPSRYEGYGIVYAEALASGLPVVACDVGPVPDLVGREAAVLVPPEDRTSLSAALDLLLGNPALRTKMSEAAIRRASRLPRWEDTIAGFEEVLATAVFAPKQARPPEAQSRRKEKRQGGDNVDAAEHRAFEPVGLSVEGDEARYDHGGPEGAELQGGEDQAQRAAEQRP
jgi:glycosyltransferase involved in cell wall biosynthesis